MMTYILVLVYTIFTSVGLSTFLLGSAWPVMQIELMLPLYGAGFISAIISGGMIVSSFFGGKIINCLGTAKTFLISLLMTGISMICYWKLPTFIFLCIAACPLGLGIGTLNVTSNHFISSNYRSSHMNWMHGFWGIGATVGPLLMSYFIINSSWRKGYFCISIIYFLLAILLFFSIPLFKRINEKEKKNENINGHIKNIYKLPKLKLTLLSFLCCGAIEQTIGLWGSSYLLNCKKISAGVAAACLSFYFVGVTIGRFISGVIAIKIKTDLLIKIGLGIEMVGAFCLASPLPVFLSMMGLILIGFGSAPVFPCMTQQTTQKFGREQLGTIIGLQISFGFIGSTFVPPVFGWIASKLSMIIFPFVILGLLVVMLVSNKKVG